MIRNEHQDDEAFASGLPTPSSGSQEEEPHREPPLPDIRLRRGFSRRDFLLGCLTGLVGAKGCDAVSQFRHEQEEHKKDEDEQINIWLANADRASRQLINNDLQLPNEQRIRELQESLGRLQEFRKRNRAALGRHPVFSERVMSIENQLRTAIDALKNR